MFALKRVYMPPEPTVNIHLLTIMLCYLAQYSTTCTLEGCVQYYSMSVLTLPFSFTFVSMTITAGRTSQIICQKSETVSGVGPAGRYTHTHYCSCSIIFIL